MPLDDRRSSPGSWLTRNILILGLVSLFTDLSTEMGYALIPIFLKDVLKASPVFIGLIEAIAEATASVLKAFSGYISDRIRKRKLPSLLGYSLSTLTKPFLAIATRPWHVFFIRFSDRFGKGIRAAPRDALIADSTKAEHFGRAYGFHKMLDNLGAVLGPLAAFLVLAHSAQNFRLVFGLAFIPGFIAVLMMLLGVQDTKTTSKPNFSFSWRKLSPRFKLFLIIMVVFTLGNSSDAFLILRARDLGVTATLIPMLWLVFNVSNFFSAYPAGILSDRIGRQKVIFLGWMIFSICYAGLSFSRGSHAAWFIFLVYGFYYGFSEGNIKAFIADITTPELRGTAFGIFHTVIGLTLLPANLVMGWLWQAVGFQKALWAGAGLSLIAGLALITLGAGSPAEVSGRK